MQADVRGLLGYRPNCPFFVVMHDSFNPPVREGIRSAPWADNPHVHAVELDFVPGLLTLDPEAYREMWGGLALAVLLPEKRPGSLTVTGRMEHQFRHLYRKSSHYKFDLQTLPGRVVNKCRNMVGLKATH